MRQNVLAFRYKTDLTETTIIFEFSAAGQQPCRSFYTELSFLGTNLNNFTNPCSKWVGIWVVFSKF